MISPLSLGIGIAKTIAPLASVGPTLALSAFPVSPFAVAGIFMSLGPTLKAMFSSGLYLVPCTLPPVLRLPEASRPSWAPQSISSAADARRCASACAAACPHVTGPIRTACIARCNRSCYCTYDPSARRFVEGGV